ncbi:hypothetical protein A1D22_10195 [Pasteurellaceae bacterium LFhippo2]|nr:hypothetical protein [Pasteurellaceae bacterium LFhippo2]
MEQGFQMPFTLSHPFAVLAFPRNKYFHFPALVFGSMSPDFGYFLVGKPINSGHTVFASELINLPLCLLFYGIYHFIVAKPLKENLPRFLSSNVPQAEVKNPLLWLLIFTYSAWLGMLTHIGLDHFTHWNGYFVEQFLVLNERLFGLPIFKWLQYGGGVFGLLAIILYQWRMAVKYPYCSTQTTRQKTSFWLSVLILTLILLTGWYRVYPTSVDNYVIHLIRGIDCGMVSLVVHCGLWQRHYTKR